MAKRKNLILCIILCSVLALGLVFAVIDIPDAQGTAYAGTTPDYLCFTAEEAGAEISMKVTNSPNINLETSTDCNIWTEFIPGTTVITLSDVGDKVYFRGNNPDEFGVSRSSDASDKHYVTFVLSKLVGASGNIMSLISNDCSCLTIPSTYCFYSLFSECSELTTAPVLPATTLKDSCYYRMFYKCTNLVTAPALPATVLTADCYNYMFNGCSRLTTALALPATTLATRCYTSMFTNCGELTASPALPATTLANNCYQNMFLSCKKLTTVPALPATNLAEYCYSSMFSACTLITESPALPATTLANNCYQNMFSGCSKLASAPVLPATVMKQSCYSGMFKNCTSLTTAPALPATEMAVSCYSDMFFGCGELTAAPVLPATALVNNCYQNMFSKCSKLTTAPVLCATTLAEGCYKRMFDSCSGLNQIVMIATDISATNCLSYWVSGVSSTGTIYIASGMDIPSGSSGIPNNWSVKECYVATLPVNENAVFTIGKNYVEKDGYEANSAEISISVLPKSGYCLKENGLTVTYNDGTEHSVKITQDVQNKTKYTFKLPAANVVISAEIEQIIIEKPSADTTEFTYTGTEITYNVPSNDYYTVSGNVETNAGTYTVTVSLAENIKWSDDTTDDLTFDFNIKKADNEITVLSLDSWEYGKTPGTLRAESKFGDVEILYSKADVRNFEIEVLPTAIGKYVVKAFVFGNDNYGAVDKELEFSVYQRAEDISVVDENNQIIENPCVEIISSDNGIDPDAVFVVKVVNTENAEDTANTENVLKAANKLSGDDKIYGIYDAKLIAGDVEIQPNGKITIKMLVPEELRGKEFKLYHIHNGNDVIGISYTDIDENGFITFETDKLSQFAFVAQYSEAEPNGLSAGAIAGICVGCVAGVSVVSILAYFLLKNRKPKKI